MYCKINYLERELDIQFDLQPEEPMTHEYPGCPAEITITEVEYNSKEMSDILARYAILYNIDVEVDMVNLIWDELS